MPQTFEDYKDELTTLIADAQREVTAAATPDPRREIAKDYAKRLVDFANATPLDGPPGIDKLDRLANKTANDLMAIAIGASVSAIAARAAELAALAAALDSATAANVSAEKRLKLQPVRDAIGGISDAVAAAKAATKALDRANPDEASILAAIDEVSNTYAKVRAALDKAGA